MSNETNQTLKILKLIATGLALAGSLAYAYTNNTFYLKTKGERLEEATMNLKEDVTEIKADVKKLLRWTAK